MAPTITLTPTVAEDTDALWAIHVTPEVSKWWDLPDEGFPMEDEPEATRFTIRYGDEIAGMIQYGEEPEPKYRHAWIDIFVAPHLHGRGIGVEAIRQVLRILFEELGHHRVTIDPALENSAAVRCYEKAGFEAVGVMRLAERDSTGGGWHDSLMMELVQGTAATGDHRGRALDSSASSHRHAARGARSAARARGRGRPGGEEEEHQA